MKKKHWLILMVVLILLGASLIVVAAQDQIFYPGNYFSTAPISVNRLTKSNAGARVLMDISLEPDELDQSQEIQGGMVDIGYPVPGFCVSQEVVNDRDSLLGFAVLIRTVGYTPPDTLYFGIMKELDDPLYAESWDAFYFIENVMINSWIWLSVEFITPMDIDAGETFNIVLFSADNPLDGSCWYWGCSSEETYHGNVHYWNFDSGSWGISSGIDMCFRTYTEEGDDPPPPPPPDVGLSKGITCKYAGPDCGDEGPRVTEFDIGEEIYAYSKFSASGGYDFYGKTMKHKWFYNGEEVWEWTKTCSYHYTEYWCGWTWWDIGSDYGSGQGNIKFYIDDIYLGQTGLFNVIDPNPPEPPSISITANSWVIIQQASAVFCWIGAAISGFKFVGFI